MNLKAIFDAIRYIKTPLQLAAFALALATIIVIAFITSSNFHDAAQRHSGPRRPHGYTFADVGFADKNASVRVDIGLTDIV